jgi:hypothetical protein
MADREGAGANDNAGETTRHAEATSKETLGDIEDEEAGAQSAPTGSASSDAPSNDQGAVESATPSPDGAFDSPRGGRADGGDTGGPM